MRADALERYRHKRDFDRTPEPRAKPVRATKKSQLRFVIQKHWASRLHYDFRLELDGTLKSWAVPKGPSLDPKVKRMAVEVEDHPLDYAGFEGEIPEGEYGAGKVMVWDEGSWEPIGDPAKSYREGRLKFQLRGHKLQGQTRGLVADQGARRAGAVGARIQRGRRAAGFGQAHPA